MEPRIEILSKKNLVGKSTRMSLVNNKTRELWHSFMVDREDISNVIGTDLYSIQTYDKLNYFDDFSPQTEFTKWAAIEVDSINNIPYGFMNFAIDSGLYAVFTHKGPASEFPKTFQYILGVWLPKSEYELDHRPHFELLGKKYINEDSNSEEEVWIPIKKKD